jgi:putative chitinase
MYPTDDLLRAIAATAPNANAALWAAALAVPTHSSGITTPNRIAMFIGQVAEESGDFRLMSEDFWYSTAERIREVWPTHFANQEDAAPFVGRPRALANRVYANRMGNGDEESGDGWRFRGRGLIQITGRAMYAAFAKVEPRASDPDWLTTAPGAAASACWFWTLPHPGLPSLNSLADAWDVPRVTQRVNGGTDGLAAREASCQSARSAFAITRKAATAGSLA